MAASLKSVLKTMQVRTGCVDTLVAKMIPTEQSSNLSTKQSLAARILLAQLLSLPLSVVFSPTFMGHQPAGKPFLPELPQCHFNLTHSHQCVAVVVDRLPVGIDVEKQRPFSYLKIKHAFSEAELKFLQQTPGLNQSAVTLKLWTVKEAVLKLEGIGLAGNPKSVHVRLSDFGQAERFSKQYRLFNLELGATYVGTIAQRKEGV